MMMLWDQAHPYIQSTTVLCDTSIYIDDGKITLVFGILLIMDSYSFAYLNGVQRSTLISASGQVRAKFLLYKYFSPYRS